MISQKTPFSALSVALLALLLLTPVVAQAVPQNLVVLELEFSNIATAPSSCPVESVVVISATDCDGGMLADKIVDELNAHGLGAGPINPGCGRSVPDGEFQCVWNVPARCEQIRERATVELGSTCGDAGISGTVREPFPNAGFFFFEIH